MIIMINGAFGAGKTTVAQQLKEKISNSMIFDPEAVGMLLRDTVPKDLMKENEKTGDFQDFELWPKLVVMIAAELKEKYGCHLIVPMTLRKIDYFRYIFDGLKSLDKDTCHFCLTASLTTIHKRLEQRGEKPGSWGFLQTEKCIAAYENYDFGEYIDTENIDVADVVGIITDQVNRMR